MTLGKLFMRTCLCHQAVEFGTGLTGGKVTAVYGREISIRTTELFTFAADQGSLETKMNSARISQRAVKESAVDHW